MDTQGHGDTHAEQPHSVLLLIPAISPQRVFSWEFCATRLPVLELSTAGKLMSFCQKNTDLVGEQGCGTAHIPSLNSVLLVFFGQDLKQLSSGRHFFFFLER